MSAACVRWFLSHAVRNASSGRPGFWTSSSRSPIFSEKHNIFTASWRRVPFSTEGHDLEQSPATKKKKQDARAQASVNSIGRKIPHREIQVIGESGENLGVMHRADVIRVMDEKDLKLVLLSERKDPPVYRLMSGKQIHEEQLKQREKNKVKAAPVQVKEVTLSVGIAPHDLITKLKQVESWVEKKHHVRITLRGGHAQPAVHLDTALEQMIEQMNVMVGFVSKPKVIRDGKAATCILRPPSAKELSQKAKNKDEASQSVRTSEEAQSETPPVSDTDTTGEFVKQ